MAWNDTQRGYFFMVLLAIQFAVQPFLGKAYTAPEVSKPALVLVCEVLKLLFSVILLAGEGQIAASLRGWTVMDSLKVAALPACLYSVQNICIQVAYRSLDSLTFNLTNQTKLLFTAVFLYLLMGRKQSAVQCVALSMLVAAAVLLANDDKAGSAKSAQADSEYVFGFALSMTAAVLSGFSATLSQITLQGKARNSYLFSIELAFFSLLSLLIPAVVSGNLHLSSFVVGWTPYTFIPIVVNALGGIVVGQVTKYAGGVKKGFAIIGGILITSFIQSSVDGIPFTAPLWTALSLVVASTWLHAAYPYVETKPKAKTT